MQHNTTDGLDYDYYDSGVRAVAGVYIGIAAITIVLNVVEIVLFARKRLRPGVAVGSSCTTTVIWLGIFVLFTIAAVGGATSILNWIVVIVALSTSIGKLAYGSVILHRYRKRFAHRGGAYTSAAVVESEFDSSPSGPYTAYNAAGPMRHASPAVGHQPSGAAGQYYDPESLRGYELPEQQRKATTRYA